MSDSEDWLETPQYEVVPVAQTPQLPAAIELPSTLAERNALVKSCWDRLTEPQRMFLTALRLHGFNARKVQRETGLSRSTHKGWLHNTNYSTVMKLWLQVASGQAQDRDRLLVRQDEIVETLLTPKPVLYQGEHTGFEEVEAGAAARANETLMKAAGLLKDKEVDLNIGIIGPSFTIQVVQPAGDVIDVTPSGVPVQLPEPDADWTE